MENVLIFPDEIWDYFRSHEAELAVSEHMVAECPDYGVKVFVTAMEGDFQIVVEADDEEIYRETVASKDACEETVSEIYDAYLTGEAFENLGGIYIDSPEENEKETQAEMIEERELELQDAMYNFCKVAMDTTSMSALTDMQIEDMVDHVLEYMYRKWDLEIYRPMFIEDSDTKEKFFEEYPYGHLEFDDENNPIYK